MSEKIENILNECLDRIAQGESIESCLQSYPREAAQLEPLLRTAFGFNWRASAIKPRPEFKAQARAQIQFQAAQMYATRREHPQHSGIFNWQRAWVVALTAILLFIFTGAGTVAASSNALPDQPLYSVKLATEEIRLALETSNAGKAQLHTQLAETRATEIEAMAHQGKTDQVVATTERLVAHLEEATVAFTVAEQQASAETPQPSTTALETAPTPTSTEEETTQLVDNTTETTLTTKSTEETTRATSAPTEVTPTPTTTESSSSGKATQPSKTTRQSEKIYKLNQSMKKSNSRSLAALRKALEEAPPEAKPALQRAINALLEKGHDELLDRPSTEYQQQEQEQKQEQGQELEQEQSQNQDQAQEQEQEPTQNQEQGRTTWFKKYTRNQISGQKTTNHLDTKTNNKTETAK